MGSLAPTRGKPFTPHVDPWDAPTQSRPPPTGNSTQWDPDAERSTTASTYKPVAAAKRTSLVTWEDSSLTFGYDTHVKHETAKIRGRSAAEVHSILRVAASEGTPASIYRVQACVNYLLGDEIGEGPSVRLYSALILAQCRADGTVMEVERLLAEMADEGLELDSAVCHDVLKVLSVHPDYLLRTEILNYMRAKWFQLSDGGWHDVVAGLVREGSLEMAMDRMEEMQRSNIRVLGWLYDMLVYALAARDELDEILRLLQQRVHDGDTNISPTLWYYVLDVAARQLHYPLASYVWNRRVRNHYLNPSAGICLNVMALAARARDTQLAQDVFDLLAQRDTVFEAQHYELLIEAYVNAGSAENGFYILSAMQAAGVIPTEGTTRRLAVYLRSSKQPTDIIESMFSVLTDIKEQRGGLIPVAAVNVLIEVAATQRQLDLAVDLYKAIPGLCVTGANLATFNMLFRLCHRTGRKDLALQLAAEMVAMRILPSALTYDRMMLVCLTPPSSDSSSTTQPTPSSSPSSSASQEPNEAREEPPYEDAIRYYREMRAKGFEPRFGSALALVRTLTRAGDARVDGVVDELEGMDLPIRIKELRRWVAGNFGREDDGGRMEDVLGVVKESGGGGGG